MKFLLDCAEIFSIIFSNLICKNLSALYLKGLFSLTESVETRLFYRLKKSLKFFQFVFANSARRIILKV
ncbi:MAG: hypothetical protein WC082_09770, partial [Victivallales bacterium]